MKNSIVNRIKSNSAWRRVVSLLLAMAVVLSTGSVFEAVSSDNAAAGAPVCGLGEHTHNGSCYVIDAEDVEQLVCQTPEHTHDETCYADINTDLGDDGTDDIGDAADENVTDGTFDNDGDIVGDNNGDAETGDTDTGDGDIDNPDDFADSSETPDDENGSDIPEDDAPEQGDPDIDNEDDNTEDQGDPADPSETPDDENGSDVPDDDAPEQDDPGQNGADMPVAGSGPTATLPDNSDFINNGEPLLGEVYCGVEYNHKHIEGVCYTVQYVYPEPYFEGAAPIYEKITYICELHEHSEDCYVNSNVPVCGKEEHVHSVGTCKYHWNQVGIEELVWDCNIEEHTHTKECYIDNGESADIPLYCGKEEHVHVPACYGTAIICTEDHEHNANCYDYAALVCGKEEHVHAAMCYTPEPILYCGKPEHEHTTDCYGKLMICREDNEGHVHGEECYVVWDIVICEMEEHIHEEYCYDPEYEGENVDELPMADAIAGKPDGLDYGKFVIVFSDNTTKTIGSGETIEIESGKTFTFYAMLGADDYIDDNPMSYFSVDNNDYNNDYDVNILHCIDPQFGDSVDKTDNAVIVSRKYTANYIISSPCQVYCKVNGIDYNFYIKVVMPKDTLCIADSEGGYWPVNDKSITLTVGESITLYTEINGSFVPGQGNYWRSNQQYGDNNRSGEIVDIVNGLPSSSSRGVITANRLGTVTVNINNNDYNGTNYNIGKITITVVNGPYEENVIYVDKGDGDGYQKAENNAEFVLAVGETLNVRATSSVDFNTSNGHDFGNFYVAEGDENRITIENTRYTSTTIGTITAKEAGEWTVHIYTNDGINARITIRVEHAFNITVDMVKVGTKVFNNVEKSVATQMLLGTTVSGKAVRNSKDFRYIVYVNRDVDVRCDNIDDKAYNFTVSGNDFKEGEYTFANHIERVRSNVPGSGNLTGGFTAKNVGNCEIVIKENEANWGDWLDSFYIQVRYPIYVETALGEIHKDRVHEALDRLHGGIVSEAFISDPDGNRLYVKNANTTYGTGNFEGVSANERYVICPGDELTLVTYAYLDNSNGRGLILPEWKLGSNLENRVVTYTHIESGVETDYEPNVSGMYRIELKFRVSDSAKHGTLTQVDLINRNTNSNASGSEFDEHFYIYIVENDDDDHCDIEITDGGTYKLTKTKINYITLPNGEQITETITEVYTYEAYVVGVNMCTVYAEDGKTFSDGSSIYQLDSNEYAMHGSPDDPTNTQFEYTSAYKTDKNGHFVDDNNNIVEPNFAGIARRSINHANVEKVVFNLKLRLLPKEDEYGNVATVESTVRYTDSDGNPVTDGSYTDGDGKTYYFSNTVGPNNGASISPTTVDEVPVELKKQAVIDAYNKCPNHLGLDFTLAEFIYATETSPTAQKRFIGGTLTEDMFGFELYNVDPIAIPNAKPYTTRWVSANGSVKFGIVNIIKQGDIDPDPTYLYIKEIWGIHNSSEIYGDTVIYDDKVYRIKISAITNPINSNLEASITYQYWSGDNGWVELADDANMNNYPTFYNFVPFDLPATGGSGTTRYYIFGIALLITGFLLLFSYRRRRGSRLTANSAMGKQ